ncbi:hypothetical protein AMATHDRAFT_144367 [Amanita thiersii Skay4041]|uniref:Ras modification protein ERF4 n=1 Tax=Amanita thiersii Skay4041 TaxID=703135 RepID=A0A2A9NSI1_9AGAR|nr:hypothetical protein AMATHDRAFT_144367 [Amanita thiersii Skay4041]
MTANSVSNAQVEDESLHVTNDGAVPRRFSQEKPSFDTIGLASESSGAQGTSTTDEDQTKEVSWDPLQSPSKDGGDDDATAPVKGMDLTGEVEEGDVTDSNGRLEDRVETNTDAAKRASHLRFNIKPSSPPIWEVLGHTDNERQKEENGVHIAPRNQTRSLIPKSSYYYGSPGADTAYGTSPIGHIGVHHPREILRIERDYSGGEVIQFTPSYPLELEGRITPTQFLESINTINEILISAHSLRSSFVDNILAVFTLQLSRLIYVSHYKKEMRRLREVISELNEGLYNPVGLNILWPRNVAFLYVSLRLMINAFTT